MPEPANNADEYALQAMEWLHEGAQLVRSYTGKQMQQMKKYHDASVKPKQFGENKEVLLFDSRKKRGQFAKWQVTWKGPFIIKKRLNDCNYVLQKSAKSRPFVVHVDRMCKYLHEQRDSNAENVDMLPLSDNSNVQGRLLRSPGRMSKADINANTPSKQAIAYQSEKSSATAKPTDSIMPHPPQL